MPVESEESFGNPRYERADSLGLAFLRTIILLNGGALLAILTYLGNSSAQTAVTLSLVSVKVAMCLFLVGIVSTLVGLIISYLRYSVAPTLTVSAWLSTKIAAINASIAIVSLSAFAIGVLELIFGATPTV